MADILIINPDCSPVIRAYVNDKLARDGAAIVNQEGDGRYVRRGNSPFDLQSQK